MKYFYSLFLFLFLFFTAAAQKNIADSLLNLLTAEKKDTSRVKLMWQAGSAISNYNTEEALAISQKAVFFAKKINYKEGLSRSLGVLANTLLNIGNYPLALQYNLEKLKIEEKRENYRNLASVLMNIAIIYVLQEEYQKALPYFKKSDSVITRFNVTDLEYNIKVNTGDIYDRLNNTDSAYHYFLQSLQIANAENNADYKGASLTGLGHYYRKKGFYDTSRNTYQSAIVFLQEANDDYVLCEATLGLAKLYRQFNRYDSAAMLAGRSNSIARNAGFLPNQLEATEFLKDLYRQQKNIDSAFHYYTIVQALNDSVNSKTKIREMQTLFINEQLRQMQLEEDAKEAKEERRQQLQLLFIALFIPGFFLFTLLLSRIRIPVRLIKILGILSLLILFEFLTLLLHPTVKEITHHTPVYEMFIFVAMAAFLIPAHHRIEHWLIHKLVQNREKLSPHQKIHLKTGKLKMKINKES